MSEAVRQCSPTWTCPKDITIASWRRTHRTLQVFRHTLAYIGTRGLITGCGQGLQHSKGPFRMHFFTISRTFWPSLGHLGRQQHVLESVWPSKRHFLEIEEGIHWYRTPWLCIFCMFSNFEPPFCFQLLSPLGFLRFSSCKIHCFLITKNGNYIHKR